MIVLLGNCQIDRLQYVLRVNGITGFIYRANTDRLDPEMDVAQIFHDVAAATLGIAQPIFNPQNPLYFEKIRDAAQQVIFVPYVFLDGLFSLSAADAGCTLYYGEEQIAPSYFTIGVGALLDDFLKGNIDFANQSRLQTSFADLQRRERESGAVIISDYLAETYQDNEILISHNHPKPHVFDVLCARVFARAGLAYRPLATLRHHEAAEYAFGMTPRVCSPYDAEALGLRYQPDEQWWPGGTPILQSIWQRHTHR